MVIVIIVIPITINCQETVEEDDRWFIIEPLFTLNNFQGKLSRNLDADYGVGISITALMQSYANSPFFFGLQLDYSYLTGYSNSFNEIIDGSSVEVETSANTSVGMAIPKCRYYLPKEFWGISFYTEFGLNFKWIYNYSSYSISEFDESDGTFNEHSFSMGYYGGLGLNVVLNGNYFLCAKASYINGASADYWVKKEFLDETTDSIDSFEKKSSAINFFSYQLGISFFL